MSKRKEILEKCKVQPHDIHKFVLIEDFEYDGHIVPKGYCTDGASIPRLAWFIYPPNRPDYLPAAIIHDFLCDKENYKEADRIFKKCLNDLNIHPNTVFIFHTGVVLFHKVRYYLPEKISRIKNGI